MKIVTTNQNGNITRTENFGLKQDLLKKDNRLAKQTKTKLSKHAKKTKNSKTLNNRKISKLSVLMSAKPLAQS